MIVLKDDLILQVFKVLEALFSKSHFIIEFQFLFLRT